MVSKTSLDGRRLKAEAEVEEMRLKAAEQEEKVMSALGEAER